jgi:hypothetical protein
MLEALQSCTHAGFEITSLSMGVTFGAFYLYNKEEGSKLLQVL